MKNKITKSEAMIIINKGGTIKNDTIDGFASIKKKLKGVYETKIYTNGTADPEVLISDFKGLMKLINRFDEFYTDDL